MSKDETKENEPEKPKPPTKPDVTTLDEEPGGGSNPPDTPKPPKH